ncbi:glycosyltransferase family 2 protein [Pseudoalteromonas xiamenensis]
MNDITVLILTFNEEKHIARCIDSLLPFTNKIIIVDSYSTDKTVEIAESKGAKVFKNRWVNYATQYQWGLDNCQISTEWVMRMDADEYVEADLAIEINNKLLTLPQDITGIYVKRKVKFMGRWIKHGGYYPTWLLRVWRFKAGRIEERWMDEHIKLSYGKHVHFVNDIVDENTNDLSWWTQKHNGYATREAVDLLNTLYQFKVYDEVTPEFFGSQEQRKRLLKLYYCRLPLFLRPVIYFVWRFVFKLGFLDGMPGLIWHSLQGGWYRFLVDAKIFEIYSTAGYEKEDVRHFLKNNYGVFFDES